MHLRSIIKSFQGSQPSAVSFSANLIPIMFYPPLPPPNPGSERSSRISLAMRSRQSLQSSRMCLCVHGHIRRSGVGMGVGEGGQSFGILRFLFPSSPDGYQSLSQQGPIFNVVRLKRHSEELSSISYDLQCYLESSRRVASSV